jgi:hypothetical protein
VSPQFGRFNKKKNSYSAPPQAAAGVTKKEEAQPTCSPLTGGSGPRKNPDFDHELLHLSERDRNYIFTIRAIAAEADAELAEQARKKREAERNS